MVSFYESDLLFFKFDKDSINSHFLLFTFSATDYANDIDFKHLSLSLTHKHISSQVHTHTPIHTCTQAIHTHARTHARMHPLTQSLTLSVCLLLCFSSSHFSAFKKPDLEIGMEQDPNDETDKKITFGCRAKLVRSLAIWPISNSEIILGIQY